MLRRFVSLPIPLLLRFPPEAAHRLVMFGLHLLQWLGFGLLRQRLRRRTSMLVPSLPRVPFSNRVGLAAGFDKNAEAYGALAAMGFGFLELGTVTPLPQPGNPKPRIFRHRDRDALVNCLGFNSGGAAAFARRLSRYRDQVAPAAPLWINVGKNKNTENENAIDDYQLLFKLLTPLADVFVVNLSSPNTPGLRDLQSERFLGEIAAVVPTTVPVLVKFAPDLSDEALTTLCAAVGAERRFAGVVVTNTSRQLAERLVGAPQGGLSGAPLLPRALQCVALARKAVGPSKCVVGVGGIVDARGALQMREAGADLLELYTGFVYRGPALLGELLRHPELVR